ncbi:MAG: hypothetical protein OXG46_00160 [Chloroflexi bacterium]|nr:hypothetical protein [Chloroflexota bacterium]MCY3938149.1 hypothetical protein [Chloroflexota bacterium]
MSNSGQHQVVETSLPDVDSKLRAIGAHRILDLSLTALFCSVRCPGDLILKTYDLARLLRDAGVPVIAGFQSPMEKDCLEILLRGKQPAVVCPARGVGLMRVPSAWRAPIEDGRLLVVSPFDDSQRRVTAKLARERNEFVARLARALLLIHAAPGGKTEQLARRTLADGKPVFTLESPNNANLIELGIRPVQVADVPNLLTETLETSSD